MPGTANNPADVVFRLLRALRAHDDAAVAGQLHPDVEATGARGKKHGIDEVVAWAKPTTDGELHSLVEVDEIREVGDRWVAVAARRQWSWAETGELATEDPFGVLFEVRDGKVVSWDQTHSAIADAIDAIPR